MSRTVRLATFGALLCILATATGCGGGGGGTAAGSSTPGSSAPKTLHWTPPTAYSDGSALDPATEIDSFEIYVKNTPAFTNGDAPTVQVGALDPGTGQVVTSFSLGNLNSLSPGVTYFVSVRATAKNGEKSSFSASASFSL